ncbi:hypothetical protein C349_06579 [Cryptococcus neoformans var. grubii Br795]|uniref:Alpha/beta hydrolase fold-3 domain-containing protein n=1 Tax=Cryptococcus neoformans Tu259-1 TaxID=1230072 RepID=A0A854QBN5_CRYNE|nr:hypothetical protein C353_06488 [Cryptococcus neoformans var. grubii AD1-83a]OWZ50586.1 hypothetical protein C368_06731 [Cryptococcus neoformans var. grubii 125.91]OWZ76944.1 hypothetical protein C365_05101 [Cryptococcus neoformans var. grubii Bt85]OXG11558.1 hypothetical protein C361_06665 [Cryptococcus neoformans var. grubii Tu259-1]OXG46558.1 hypothetical protein C354_06475 [Cryptococcus neoformans var. grubii MW-RSA1955]OXG49836.1 hypothetical protein C352_06493 [Cryptococcus neoformans
MVFFLELPPLPHRLLDVLIYPIAQFLILPLTTVYHTLRYVILGPPFPGWTLSHYLAINRRRVFYGLYTWRRVALFDPEEAEMPREAKKYLVSDANGDGRCDAEKVECVPYKEDEFTPPVLRVARDSIVQKAVPGFWIEARGVDGKQDLTRDAAPGERVIYFIVGGGYMGGHPLRIHTPWSLAKISKARVFSANYRKSLSDSTAFPCSLLDTLAGYQYLIEEKHFEPKNIILCGDSAGGNACLALAKCLGEMESLSSKRFGQVGGLCLHSPWSDMTSSFPSIVSNRYNDHLVDLTTSYIPSHTRHFTDKTNPYLSPALSPFGSFEYLKGHDTKVYISAGSAEAFYDEILALYNGMKRDGVEVELRVLEGATHSEFIWLDRDEVSTMGWSWDILTTDFERLWERAA